MRENPVRSTSFFFLTGLNLGYEKTSRLEFGQMDTLLGLVRSGRLNSKASATPGQKPNHFHTCMQTINVRSVWMNQLRELVGKLITSSTSTASFNLFPLNP